MRTPSFGFLAPVLLLTACGYAPLYVPAEGDTSAASHVQIGAITIGSITGLNGSTVGKNVGQRRSAETVSQRLQLDYPGHNTSMDTATVVVDEATGTLATQTSSALQRAQINLTGNLTITSPQGKTLLRTSLSTYSAYNVENTPYSTESGKTFARLTAARDLADELSRRIALYYRTRKLLPVEPQAVVKEVTATTIISASVPLKLPTAFPLGIM